MTKYKLFSIIVPVYNEDRTIGKLLKKLLGVKFPIDFEVICIDDGSSDNSGKIIKKIMKKNSKIQYFYKGNGGKGSAIRMGFKKSSGDILAVQDADLEYDPNDFLKMIKIIMSGKTNVVYGSRYMEDLGKFEKNDHLTYKIHLYGNKLLSFLSSLLYGAKLTDMETCYKMFTRNVYEKFNLVSDKFDIEPEITAKIIKSGEKIIEIPIRYHSRDFKDGKKITWIDGLIAVFSLVKWKFK